MNRTPLGHSGRISALRSLFLPIGVLILAIFFVEFPVKSC
jgi:hypothetical protein